MVSGVIIVLLIVIVVLCIKIITMRRAVSEITQQFKEWSETDTNTLLGISSVDPYMRKLVYGLNKELVKLRAEKIQYHQGDQEVKNAIMNLSHDLRTPLTAICGYMDLLRKEEKSEEVERYLAIVEERVENMKALTEELFRYSIVMSSEDLKYSSVDVCRVLEESLLTFFATFVQKGIEPEIVIPKEAVVRNLDAVALTRIFSNIISNAGKYGETDFKVEVSSDGTIVFSNAASELTPVMVEKLFDRFYTVEAGRNSTGLGLSIAKHLTESMNGKIRAEYKEGRLFIILYFLE